MSRHHTHLNGRRWDTVRRAVLEGDSYRCLKCGRAGRLEVDYVQPLKRGGDPWTLNNLQSLCRRCHIEKPRAENRRPPTPAEAAWRRLVGEMMRQHQ